MLVLALDTSSAAVAVAVVDVGDTVRVLARSVTVDGRGHAEHLSPNIAACLAESARTAQDLNAIVVGTGPGPFTGLRVGLVTAAALAESLGVAAYGVCSLDGFGSTRSGSVLVATDARRKEVFWARYLDGVRTDGPAVDLPGDVPLDGLDAMSGAGANLYADVLGLPVIGAEYPDPAALIERARAQLLVGAPSDPLTPLYLRRPDAVPPKSMSATQVEHPVVPMTARHIDLLMPYESDMFGTEAWTASGYRSELTDTRRRHYVAVEDADGALLGWAGILLAADTSELLTVGVVPAARRTGLARRMLAELYVQAVRRSAREMFLEVRIDNYSAISLYTAEGFVEVGRRRGYYENGRVDALVMRRELG